VKLNLLAALLVAIAVTGCGNQKKDGTMSNFSARQIKLGQLPDVLNELAQKKLEYDFFGITSNGIDCLYFVPVNGKLDLEFEAMSPDQIPYIDKLRMYARTRGFSVVDTTYGNEPLYESSIKAPVIRLETNATIEDAVLIGTGIMKDVFGCSDSTTFDVVP
jgi:hypothetical protein